MRVECASNFTLHGITMMKQPDGYSIEILGNIDTDILNSNASFYICNVESLS